MSLFLFRASGTSVTEALDRLTLESTQRKIVMLDEKLEATVVTREAERVRLDNNIASLEMLFLTLMRI